MIAIIDYGAGNLRSVVNAISHLGYEPKLTNRPDEVMAASTVVLPGVGAGADTVSSLKKLGLDEVIRRIIVDDRPFLGVCIGLQVLFTGTEEGGWHECLNAVPGKVQRLPDGLKVPHIGWNQVKQLRQHPVFQGIPDMSNFYFVHSYHGVPDDNSLIAGETEYGVPFCSVLIRGNLVATQFHPEKSGVMGLKFYDNFLRFARRKSRVVSVYK